MQIHSNSKCFGVWVNDRLFWVDTCSAGNPPSLRGMKRLCGWDLALPVFTVGIIGDATEKDRVIETARPWLNINGIAGPLRRITCTNDGVTHRSIAHASWGTGIPSQEIHRHMRWPSDHPTAGAGQVFQWARRDDRTA